MHCRTQRDNDIGSDVLRGSMQLPVEEKFPALSPKKKNNVRAIISSAAFLQADDAKIKMYYFQRQKLSYQNKSPIKIHHW